MGISLLKKNISGIDLSRFQRLMISITLTQGGDAIASYPGLTAVRPLALQIMNPQQATGYGMQMTSKFPPHPASPPRGRGE